MIYVLDKCFSASICVKKEYQGSKKGKSKKTANHF